MDLAGDLPGDPGLDRPQLFGIELVTSRPAVFRGRRVGDLDVDAQGAGPAALGAAGDEYSISASPARPASRSAWRSIRARPPPAPAPAGAMAQQIGHEVFGERLHQILLLGVPGQIAHRRHGDGDARQQARPAHPRHFVRAVRPGVSGAGLKAGRNPRETGSGSPGWAAVPPDSARGGQPARQRRPSARSHSRAPGFRASGATPSSRFRISAQMRYCRSASGRLPARA